MIRVMTLGLILIGISGPLVPCVSHRSPEPSEQIKKALDFIASQQKSDGSFPHKKGMDFHPHGVVAFAVLALLTYDGHEPVIEKAANWLMDSMNDKGFISGKGKQSSHPATEHAYGALALAEIYKKYKDKDSKFSSGFVAKVKDATGKALTYSSQIQMTSGKYAGAFPYGGNYADHDGEMSVSIPHLEAYRTAKAAGLSIPEDSMKKGLEFIKKYIKGSGKIFDHPFSGQDFPYEEVTAMGAALYYGVSDSSTGDKLMGYLSKSKGKLIKNMTEKEGRQAWMSGGIQLHGVLHFYIAYRRSGSVSKYSGDFSKAKEKLTSTQSSDGSWSGLYGPTWGTALSVLLIEAETNTSLHFLQ